MPIFRIFAHIWICFRSLTNLCQWKLWNFQVLNSGPSWIFLLLQKKILKEIHKCKHWMTSNHLNQLWRNGVPTFSNFNNFQTLAVTCSSTEFTPKIVDHVHNLSENILSLKFTSSWVCRNSQSSGGQNVWILTRNNIKWTY